jgi:hypothetical protein
VLEEAAEEAAAPKRPDIVVRMSRLSAQRKLEENKQDEDVFPRICWSQLGQRSKYSDCYNWKVLQLVNQMQTRLFTAGTQDRDHHPPRIILYTVNQACINADSFAIM